MPQGNSAYRYTVQTIDTSNIAHWSMACQINNKCIPHASNVAYRITVCEVDYNRIKDVRNLESQDPQALQKWKLFCERQQVLNVVVLAIGRASFLHNQGYAQAAQLSTRPAFSFQYFLKASKVGFFPIFLIDRQLPLDKCKLRIVAAIKKLKTITKCGFNTCT